MVKPKKTNPPKTLNRRLLTARLYIWQWRFALIALAAGIAATGVIQTLAPPPPPQLSVIFAARNLPVGTMLTADDVREVALPAKYAAGLVSDKNEILGRVTITGLSADSPIWRSGVSNPDLGGVAPPGTVVVPLRLDAVTTSVLMPGDKVDLVSVTNENPIVLAQNALVLPARLETTAASGGLFSVGTNTIPVTLVAVKPAEAPQVASMAHQNQITAILIP